MKRTVLTAMLMAAGIVSAAEMVTMESLLEEIVDRDRLAKVPEPFYYQKQASSYERVQLSPKDPKWFANHDYDNYIRTEEKEGRKEFVIMEEDGPGCITRWWAPLRRGHQNQVVRIYLDGAEEPTIEEKYHDFLTGGCFIKAPFADKGKDEGNIYLPIPFAKSCKVTLDDTGDKCVFFYIINYRRYDDGTEVETFSRDDLPVEMIEKTADILNKFETVSSKPEVSSSITVGAGESPGVELPSGSKAVQHISVTVDKELSHEALRGLVLRMEFDGRETVWCPVTEFFGTGIRIAAMKDWDRTVASDGRMSCSWVMPYRKNARISWVNLTGDPIELRFTVDVKDWAWDERSMHFCSAWRGDLLKAPPPPQQRHLDWNYVELAGAGTYVGDTLTVYSPHDKWWGEGDERLYVDGDRKLSHWGTGTEDYYGHAWGMRDELSTPFLSMPSRDRRGNVWSGYTTQSRVRLLDGIPFRKSFKLDMEVWTWVKDYIMHYAVGTFWYARPDAKCLVEADSKELKRELPRKPEDLLP